MGRVRPAVVEAAVETRDRSQPSAVDRANRYVSGVLDGSIPSCKWVRLACQRQRDDLAKSKQSGYPYRFDVAAAERVCRFVELSPHVKGKKFAGTLIHLEDWQCFILTTVWGWLSKSTGLRRFRRAYSEIAKGNGKSALSSALCNYTAFADGEPGAEVYSAATTRDQAKVVWSVSHAMLRAMSEFCARAGVDPAAHSINQLATNSFFRALSSDANSVEGILPYFICEDELHAHPSRDLHDNLDTANGKREGSILWIISTAGDDQAGICFEVRTYITKILDGVIQDDSFFGIIFTIDEDDDWAKGPEVWRKANPNWGVSVDPEEFAKKIQKALQSASAQPSTKTKHLNVWVNADHAWMDLQRWAKCADESLKEEDFAAQRCILGLDLASKLDLLCKAKIFWKDVPLEVARESLESGKCDSKGCDNDGKLFRDSYGAKVCESCRTRILEEGRTKRHYVVFVRSWTPEKRLEESKNAQYRGWAIDGWLDTCAGETNDYDIVENAIREDCRMNEVLEVAHDPYQAQQFVNHLQPEGIVMQEVPQVAKHLSPAMEELEAAVYDGRIKHNNNPLLTWSMSNVVCHRDKNDLMFPNKARAENKIDPVTALLTGLARVMAQDRDDSGASGGGISVFDACGKCGKICEGVKVGNQIVFDCGKHGGKA